ncbi:hypothetical protein [Bradyrhizobium sp. Cp5.3]|uniref:hypothetical protein n=1 Tax=Bradyrhizobium sp. Cp5.3 TaxID=443598 RepID=UPI000489041F|nr:hypothetical protein [Bradyrhizobium sp. Cp5.3]
MDGEDEQVDDRLIRAVARAETRARERVIRLLEAEELLDLDTETLRAKERLCVVKAAESQVGLAEAALKLQERSVLAQERQAAAMEALVATVQSVVGIGRQRCYNSTNLGGVDDDKPALFIRTGTGSKTFASAVDNSGADDD